MKRSTIIYLIISAVLIITGITLCIIGNAKSIGDGSQLFRQVKDENGNLVETIDLSEEVLNKINVNIPEADINVYGGSEKCYVEIVNFNALNYSAYTNNRALTIESDLISAMIDRVSGGDLGYNGLRDYFRIARTNDQKQINIYLTDKNYVKIFDISVTTGNVSFNNINTISDYDIKLNQGNVTFNNTSEISKISASLTNGNVVLNSLFANQAVIEIENGDFILTSPKDSLYNYNLTSATGDIKIGNDFFKGSYTAKTEESNGSLSANIGIGNINIKFDE